MSIPPWYFFQNLYYPIVSFVIFLKPFVLPLAIMCSVKPDGIPQLCKTDEIGELCVCAIATGTSYYGLSGMTKNTFEVS